MSQPSCPYCGSTEGHITTTSPVSASPLFVKKCKSCGRIVEEHRSTVQDMFVERAEDTPLCLVTPDFRNNEQYHTPPLEDDPYENIGFITAFSTWSMELAPLYTSTTSSFCGYLAELERVLLNPVNSTSGGGAAIATASTGSHSSTVDNLRAYFQILEVSSLLGLDRDISDHAVQLFRDCSAAACMRNRNVEALATAALVQASREAKEARTLQEISTAANVSQKEIHRYMKILTDALKLSQPINSNSISVYMPRFCSILELEKSTQDLATHIGEVVMNKSFCTRRNPISISAAAIYLSCQLEDKRKTQTEICKATALTEVTLRKVYKELLENIDDLLPANYTPVVPVEKAFPVSGSSSGPPLAFRGAGLGSCMEPLSVTNSFKAHGGMDSTNSPQVNSGGKNINTTSCSRAASAMERLGLLNSTNKMSNNSFKAHGGMDSTNSPQVNSGGKNINTTSCSRAPSAMERLGLLNSTNKMSKSCIKRSTVISNDDTSGLVSLPLRTTAAKTSSMSATTLMANPDRASPQWSGNSEALNKRASQNAGIMHQQYTSFRKFFQDGHPRSVAAGDLSSPTVPQPAENESLNSIVEQNRLHSGEFLPLTVTDGPSTVCPHFERVADTELAKDEVNEHLTTDRGRVQDVDNRVAANCLASECIAATCSWSPVSQDVHKGLWDLNLAVSAPQECITSPDFPAQHNVEGHGLPQENMGSLGLHRARHEVSPVNFSTLGASNPNSEPLPLVGADCKLVQPALHPSFWQSSFVPSASLNSISTSVGEHINVTSIPSNVAAKTDNRLHLATNSSETVEISRPSGPLPIASLLEKLSSNINLELTESSTSDLAIADRSHDSRSFF